KNDDGADQALAQLDQVIEERRFTALELVVPILLGRDGLLVVGHVRWSSWQPACACAPAWRAATPRREPDYRPAWRRAASSPQRAWPARPARWPPSLVRSCEHASAWAASREPVGSPNSA